MKEWGILFSAPMVRAILAGTKTQTRRAVKVPPWLAKLGPRLSDAWPDRAFGVTPCLQVPCANGTTQRLRNAWGFPNSVEGDGGTARIVPTRLWVRETWANMALPGYDPVPAYRADGDEPMPPDVRWRPSIFMPRALSRITLEVTDVRVERLQAITELDARAEGVEPRDGDGHRGYASARDRFAGLWGEINGTASWDADPWVWAVSFRTLR